jgi:hypothetical protein
MISRVRRWGLGVGSFVIAATVFAVACDSNFFLRGTINGDCDPPRTTLTDGGADTATLRKSNCQAAGALCCRRSSAAGRTSCQYPEDCYVAPYLGPCATPVDCSDTQTCVGPPAGTCQCTLGGPPCENPSTRVTACCHAGEICTSGTCGPPADGGT